MLDNQTLLAVYNGTWYYNQNMTIEEYQAKARIVYTMKNGGLVFREGENGILWLDVYAPKTFISPKRFIALCMLAAAAGFKYVAAYTRVEQTEKFLEKSGFQLIDREENLWSLQLSQS